jgi:hypothetical protein
MIVEFDPPIELNVSMEVLQFVGIADHTQLKNRDAANQHPISAITGLEEKHQSYDEALLTIGETFKAQGETITEHGRTLQTHGETLAEYGESIDRLTAFSENVATIEQVMEVLNNG